MHGVRPYKPMKDIQRKVYDKGIRIALSVKFKQSQLIVVDNFESDMKLKCDMIEKLKLLELSGKRIYFCTGSSPSPRFVNLCDQFVKKLPVFG